MLAGFAGRGENRLPAVLLAPLLGGRKLVRKKVVLLQANGKRRFREVAGPSLDEALGGLPGCEVDSGHAGPAPFRTCFLRLCGLPARIGEQGACIGIDVVLPGLGPLDRSAVSGRWLVPAWTCLCAPRCCLLPVAASSLLLEVVGGWLRRGVGEEVQGPPLVRAKALAAAGAEDESRPNQRRESSTPKPATPTTWLPVGSPIARTARQGKGGGTARMAIIRLPPRLGA